MDSPRFGLPELGIGLGLRTVHYRHIVESQPAVDWFEIISENYMQTAGRPLEWLDAIAARYPIVMHGVSMSIGGTDPLNMDYLRELRDLAERVKAVWLSDHLCWTGVAGKNTHDLLPMPYTKASLLHVVDRVRKAQDFLGRPLSLENPSTYVELAQNEMPEHVFLAELAERADCGIMLDVNNVYVSAFNHGLDPRAYFDGLPWERVVQMHVSGHTNHGSHIVDTHIGPVIDEVWQLLGEAHRKTANAAILLEWDANIPDFLTWHAEALRAKEFIAKTAHESEART